MTTLTAIANKLKESDNIIIITHSRPDGDVIGSAFGLKQALKPRNVKIICDDTISPRLQFLSEGMSTLTHTGDFVPELVVSVDTANLRLIGSLAEIYEGKIDIKIDHHPNSVEFAKLSYIDSNAAACGEIIYELVKMISPVSKETGELLYAAITSDTGSFRYRNVTSKTHRIIAELIDLGIDHAKIQDKLFGSKTQNEIQALKLAYTNVHYYRRGTIAVLNISNESKIENGLCDDDLGELNSIPRDIEGVDLGITIKQNTSDPSRYKISMRSSEMIDASILCGKFGGGGHVRASGAEIDAESTADAENIILDKVIKVLDGGN